MGLVGKESGHGVLVDDQRSVAGVSTEIVVWSKRGCRLAEVTPGHCLLVSSTQNACNI